MRLPLGPETLVLDETAVATLDLVDHSSLDWDAVRSTAYLVNQRIRYDYAGAVSRLHQRLLVQPPAWHGDQRRVSHRLEVRGARPAAVTESTDDFGNHVIEVAIPSVRTSVTFVSWTVLERRGDRPPHVVEGSALTDSRLLEPSAMTAPDATLAAAAQALAASGARGEALARAVCSWVHSTMTYAHGVTSVGTTAAEALALGRGVCQDYAHVMLAACRMLGIPSRYVSGQLLGEGGSHAWVEVLVDARDGTATVLPLDPTHDRAAGLAYVTVAVGRDYTDVAPTSGTYVAPHVGRLTATKRVAVVDVELAGLGSPC